MENVKGKLGFGCMRLPMKNGEVDTREMCDMVDVFMERGFNYFDTAHGYVGGKSEMAWCIGDTANVLACDYVGIVSANKEPNKMKKAGFTVTDSEFVDAPIINELPLALECELVEILGGGQIIGKIVNVSADESILENGDVSLDKFFPIIFDTATNGYYKLGERVGNAFKDGAQLK